MSRIDYALKVIGKHRDKLTRQQIKTLCGQAKAGNPDAALRGLDKLLAKEGQNEQRIECCG